MVKEIPGDVAEYLEYNPDTGELVWIKKTSKFSHVKVGTQPSYVDSAGYARVRFKGIEYLCHRIAWFLHTGEQPPEFIDHVDGDCANNTFTNLREATHSQNMCNKGKHSNNTSGYKGVYWSVGNKKWYSQIGLNKKRHYLGLFNTPEEAYSAYCKAANELHKEFKNYE